jgi:hypothetical protein
MQVFRRIIGAYSQVAYSIREGYANWGVRGIAVISIVEFDEKDESMQAKPETERERTRTKLVLVYCGGLIGVLPYYVILCQLSPILLPEHQGHHEKWEILLLVGAYKHVPSRWCCTYPCIPFTNPGNADTALVDLWPR